MTITEIINARKRGQVEEAYEAARALYATDRSNSVKAVMFWTACDMAHMYLSENNIDEAGKIYHALLRLHSTMEHKPNDRSQQVLQQIGRKIQRVNQPKTNSSAALGKWGECVAADYLRQKGYRIIAHDWQSGHRDIDLIAVDGTTIVFVEVKTRRNRNLVDPAFAVNRNKMRNIQRSIYHYIKTHNVGSDYRFDIISVVGTIGQQPEIDHWTNISLMM